MSLDLPKRGRLLEFSLMVAVLGLLSLFLIDALKTLQDDSERLTVELTVRNMNSGLYLQQAERVAGGRENTLKELAQANPVSWLGSSPVGYIGEQPCASVLAKGQWCWDKLSTTLYYYPKQANWLKTGGKMPWLTWRVGSPQQGASFRPGAFRLQAEIDLSLSVNQ